MLPALVFDFCFIKDVAFVENYTAFEDRKLFRVFSVNVREECFPSEIIRAKISGENH